MRSLKIAAFAAAGGLCLGAIAHADTSFFSLSSGNFSQNWSNTGLITINDNWSGVPSITGFLGDTNALTTTNVDPRTYVTAGLGAVDVIANLTTVTSTTGGVGEFEIADPVVALQGSGTADTPGLVLFLDASGREQIAVSFNVRDIDGSADDAAQQFVAQFRIGATGDFSNINSSYIADATTVNAATQVSPISFVLPSAADNQSQIELRFLTTNAAGSDEWIGIDDIVVSSTAVPEPASIACLGLGGLALLRRRRA